MAESNLSQRLVAALDEVVDEIGNASGSEAANIAVSGLRKAAGDTVYPSIYRVDAKRLWLVAQAGYTGVYDGIALERGVMARAVNAGETQFVEESSQVPDFLYAQPGFVSEVACVDENVVFNLETTSHIDRSVVEPLETFTAFLANRMRWDRSLFKMGTVARALAPMVALDDPAMIAEYAARVVATRLGLDLCQTVVLEHGSPIVATWRHPTTRVRALNSSELEAAVQEKGEFASWFGPIAELTVPWSQGKDAVVVPLHRRGMLIGGLVGAGAEIPDTEAIPETLLSIALHTSACLERAALEQRLKHSLAGRSRFMAMVSHELRTPLTAITGFTDVLLSYDELESSERDGFLTEIRNSSRHMMALIDDILEVARAEAGQLEVRTDEVVDLSEVISEAKRQVDPQAQDGETRMTLALPPRTLVVGDRLRIRQIAVNLLSNSVKFAQGGQVDVTAARHGPDINLVVEDDGIGIEPEALDTLFQPFTGHSVTNPGSGHGLGLVISRQLARAMGGDLRLDSDGPGQGARATLTLRGV